MTFVPAFRGEFGTKIREHVPIVYGMGPGHVIEIEEGDEALYPLAAERRVVPRAPDNVRRGHPTLTGPAKRFIPQPYVVQNVGTPDIVVCPRRRDDLVYRGKVQKMSLRNWSHWSALVERLQCAGLSVFAGGVADSSDTSVPCPAAWQYERPLDATIEAMLSARLVVATDSGLAHLAVLCGRPLLIVAHGRLPAPGSRWPVRVREYYQAANHRRAPIDLVDGWDDPDAVARAVVERLT